MLDGARQNRIHVGLHVVVDAPVRIGFRPDAERVARIGLTDGESLYDRVTVFRPKQRAGFQAARSRGFPRQRPFCEREPVVAGRKLDLTLI